MKKDDTQTTQTRKKPYPETIQSGIYESENLPPTKNKNRELFRVKASRFLELFPDELVIQEKTVSVIRKEFLLSFVETIPVRDIGRVTLTETGPFASLTLMGKNPEHQLQIKNLPRESAKKAKEIIDGLLLEYEKSIAIPEWLSPQTRKEVFEQAGKHSEFQKQIQSREEKYVSV